jgi:hypothetical protein
MNGAAGPRNRAADGATTKARAPTPETSAYLDLVDDSLGLPAEVRVEIRADRLGDPYSLETVFTGTAWDWLTASD